MIKGIIFDRDNTLLYFDQGKLSILKDEFSKILPQLDFFELMNYWEKREGILPKTIAEEQSFWKYFWEEEIPKVFGIDPKESTKLISTTQFYHKVYSAYEDTDEVLKKLSSTTLKLSILTNFELPNIHDTLVESGINPDYFESDLLINRSMIDVQKPNSLAYQKMLGLMKLDASEVVFVDDDLENIKGARKLGIQSYLINRSSQQNSNGTINSLKSLLRILDLKQLSK